MKLSIRAKLVAILVVAAALPLLLGIISVEYLGYRDFQRNQGRLHRVSAAHLANNLNQIASAQIQRLTDWTSLSALSQEIGAFPPVSRERATYLEENWGYYFSNTPELRAVTNNRLADRLRAFQSRNPLFAEMIVTDSHGYLLAATNRTSDYDQSDEKWWQKAARMPDGRAWVEGVAYDDSARLNALDVCLPIRSGSRVVGVLKAVLNVSGLFGHVSLIWQELGLRHVVALHDGRILARLGNPQYPPLSDRITPALQAALRLEVPPHRGEIESRSGWLILPVEEKKQEDDLAGFARLQLSAPGVDRVALDNLTPMSVVTYNDEARVLAPVHRQIWMQVLCGILLLVFFLMAGLTIAQRKIITPLRLISRAAKGLAATAQLEEESAARLAQDEARELVAQLGQVNTRDEIEDLARDFATMSRRVLSYHEHLEKELNLKTEAIQRDLRIAREFQEALLPREYPKVPEDGMQNALSLSFHHVYQPATSVCGDFFDVFKVSEGRAGVFIADVMGHGARSALVTAILRTLLQDLAGHSDDPAVILEQVNRHFFNILRGTGQFVFASAFCMVIDTVGYNVAFASAGHPSPMAVDRDGKTVEPLLPENFIDPVHANAALGLDGESTYTRHNRDLHPGDAFLLYTDGVVEAPAPDKEEFGTERLCEALHERLDGPIARLCRGVCEDVNNWMHGAPSPDDICLIGVEIGPPHLSSVPVQQNPLEGIFEGGFEGGFDSARFKAEN